MAVIDEEGRLFGRVNVIDALVVLLGLAVIVAGLALIAGGGNDVPDEKLQWNATLALGAVPAESAGLVENGTAEFAGENVSITDVYRAPGPNGSTIVLAKIAAAGERTDRGFVVGDAGGGTVLRVGERGRLETKRYTLPATVRSVGGQEIVATEEVRVTVTANVTDRVGDAISTGDVQRVGGTDTARVVDVERSNAAGPKQRVAVDLVVRARSGGEVPRYGKVPLRIGAGFPFATSRYEFQGTVEAVST